MQKIIATATYNIDSDIENVSNDNILNSYKLKLNSTDKHPHFLTLLTLIIH